MHKKKEISIKEIGQLLKTEIIGDDSLIIDDISEPESSDERSIVYLADKKHIKRIINCKAKAVLISKDIEKELLEDKILLISDDVQMSFITLLSYFQFHDDNKKVIKDNTSISESAVIEESVQIGAFAVVGDAAEIDENSIIYPNVYIGSHVKIGKNWGEC